MRLRVNKHLIVQDNFFVGAKKLRNEFDTRFKDPRQTTADRFVWDYWHVPEQYTLVRTSAQTFFAPQLIQNFMLELLAWGQENLGCRAISPPWLSYYVDGCRQELHADVPHGPWAFVYSLTPWSKRKFRGGETLIARPELLEFWRHTGPKDYHERNDFFTKVPAKFNRLVVFDPRLPHGVEAVTGVQDPREARLVLHGWFTEPRPFIEGGLSPAKAARAVGAWEDELRGQAREHAIQGMLSLRLTIAASGALRSIQILSNTLVAPFLSAQELQRWTKAGLTALARINFPKAKAGSRLTLPIYFS